MRDIFDLALALLVGAAFVVLPIVWVVSHVR